MEPNNFLSRFGSGLGRGAMAVMTGGGSEVKRYADSVEAQKLAEEENKILNRNRQLGEIIAAPVTAGEKITMLSRIGTPEAIKYAQELAKPADQPAAIQEFNAVQGMAPEQQKAYAQYQQEKNAPTPYQQQQLELERQKMQADPDYVRAQGMQQADALQAAGRPQEAAAIRQQLAPRKLSATEQKEFFEAQDISNAATGVVGALKDAANLNDKAFSGFGAETLAYANRIPGVGALINDEGATATTELNNIILGQALESLKVTFGGAPTEGERRILLDLQASIDKTPAERKVILERAISAAERRKGNADKKMSGLSGGSIYSDAVKAPTDAADAVDPRIAAARAAGYSDAEIKAFLEGKK